MKKYTEKQIEIALGIMSGRINPETDLKYFDDAKQFDPDLKNSISGRNKTPNEHRRLAEQIFMHLISQKS